MNANLSTVENALSADGFVDFYQILDASPDTPAAQIQENINARYQEAQTHRDHRVPARRRESQLLLETLPQARTILLDPARRKRYNAYCVAVAMQTPRIPYPEFLSGLLREKEEIDAGTDILTVRDLSRLRAGAPEIIDGPKRAVALPQSALNEAATPIAIAEVLNLEAEKIAPPEIALATTLKLRFSPQAWCGGAVVLVILLVFLPLLAQVSYLWCVPLAILSALVTAHVFSLAGDAIIA